MVEKVCYLNSLKDYKIEPEVCKGKKQHLNSILTINKLLLACKFDPNIDGITKAPFTRSNFLWQISCVSPCKLANWKICLKFVINMAKKICHLSKNILSCKRSYPIQGSQLLPNCRARQKWSEHKLSQIIALVLVKQRSDLMSAHFPLFCRTTRAGGWDSWSLYSEESIYIINLLINVLLKTSRTIPFSIYLDGSVRQKAAMFSPTASFGRYLSFCLLVPHNKIPCRNKINSMRHTLLLLELLCLIHNI